METVSNLDRSIKFSEDISIYTGCTGIGFLFWKVSAGSSDLNSRKYLEV